MAGQELVQHATGPGIREAYVLANVVVVGAIIYFAGWKSIKAQLLSRKETIAKSLLDGKKQLEAIEAEVAKVKKEISNLESLKAQTIASAESEAKGLSEQILAEAKMAAEKIVKEAQMAAENEVRAATSDVKKQMIAEALKLAQKQLTTDMQKQAHGHLAQTLNTEGGKTI